MMSQEHRLLLGRISILLSSLFAIASGALIAWFFLSMLRAGTFATSYFDNDLDTTHDYRQTWVLFLGNAVLVGAILLSAVYAIWTTLSAVGMWKVPAAEVDKQGNRYWDRACIMFVLVWVCAFGTWLFLFMLAEGSFGGVRQIGY